MVRTKQGHVVCVAVPQPTYCLDDSVFLFVLGTSLIILGLVRRSKALGTGMLVQWNL